MLASELFDGRLDKLVAAAAAGVWLGDDGYDIKISFNECVQAVQTKVLLRDRKSVGRERV